MREQVDAHRFGGDFIVADAFHRPSVAGIYEALNEKNRKNHPAAAPEQRCMFRDIFQPQRAVGNRHDVGEDDADDFRKAERGNGEIIAFQPQRRHADHEAEERGN